MNYIEYKELKLPMIWSIYKDRNYNGNPNNWELNLEAKFMEDGFYEIVFPYLGKEYYSDFTAEVSEGKFQVNKTVNAIYDAVNLNYHGRFIERFTLLDRKPKNPENKGVLSVTIGS